MRLWLVLLATVFGAVLSSCASMGSASPPAETPSNDAFALPAVLGEAQPVGVERLRLDERIVQQTEGGGIYASDYFSPTSGSYPEGFVAGYSGSNKGNRPPVCTIPAGYVEGVGVDPTGNLMVPAYFGGSSSGSFLINVYQGPGVCGSLIGSVPITSDAAGYPKAVASLNARTGKIVVAYPANQRPSFGELAVCALATGCGPPMTLPSIKGWAFGVALAKNGDCWMSAEKRANYDPPGVAVLAFFKNCSPPGRAAKGYKNPYYGGLFIDNKGNIGALDLNDGTLYVYNGCNPDCTLVGGPFTLKGSSVEAGLNKEGTKLAVGDNAIQAVDIYAYTPTSLTYLYSISNGLTFKNSSVISGAFSPSNAQ